MTPSGGFRYDLSWRRREVAALAVLGVLAGAALAAGASLRAPWPGCPLDRQRLRLEAAAETIDPNTASVGSLLRLPDIGARRARAIVEFRSAHGGRPFRTLDDLKQVDGIADGIVRDLGRIRQFLAIPEKP